MKFFLDDWKGLTFLCGYQEGMVGSGFNVPCDTEDGSEGGVFAAIAFGG